ncbi:rhodanese-like domain-containing protein [Tropicimonas sp. IMCC6043]|uniref:rhodanese-like domain-containing protein n=1 Tax=Tropicimonas sp. IMCC6043 TaxID=2510645 RepID=UPI00101BB535|nr:rhodanese-like domain-containing protein [Tropicimonas sp. IMCC6043]RYH08821.1 sulfurtransferase [Tropicimonas sp. IMCC6043]
MSLRSTIIGCLLVSMFAIPSFAEDATSIPAKKQTKAGLYLTSADAVDMLRDEDVVLLDVRSRAEIAFVGLPTRVDVHIPFMVMPQTISYYPEDKGYHLEMNPAFEMDFMDYADARGIDDDTPIVVICRSGSRSAKAANVLYDLGYTNVYSILDGFEGDKANTGPEAGHRTVNGWKNAGLEWSYSIAPHQAYPADRN